MLLLQACDLFKPGARDQPSGIDPMTAELLRAAERADMCTAANAVGVGLRGEYFPLPDLKGPIALVRVDEVVDFDASIWRQSELGATGRIASIRWSGWIKAPISGVYRFHAETPGMKILVARTLVAGVGAAPGAAADMAAGRFYPIEVTVNRNDESAAQIRLEWTAPHGARYVVPKTLLQLPTDTVASPRS